MTSLFISKFDLLYFVFPLYLTNFFLKIVLLHELAISLDKPHLHGRLFCNAIRRFFMRENLSRRVVTHTRRDSLAAIAFEKNRSRVSNTCDLRCRLYFARLDARILLARDHLHEVDFNVSRVPGQSRARVNSKSYAIYESPRHSAMHKCFASRWLRLC